MAKTRKIWKTLLKEVGGKILDVGCGGGYLAEFISLPNLNYHGVDISPEAINKCTNKELQVKQADVINGKIPYGDNCFDAVWCSHLIEHMDVHQQAKFFKKAYRVLKNGGKLIMLAPTPFHWNFYDEPGHIRPCTHWNLKIMAKEAGFKNAVSKYSKLRYFPEKMQSYLRILMMPFLWEVYLIAEK